MSSVIILDFDKTLFDADAFRGALAGVFARHGISAEDVYATYAMCKQHHSQKWVPEYQIELLGKKYSQIDSAYLLSNINLLCRASERFVYPDTISFLATLQGAGHELHVLSFGDERIQAEKINGCGIAKYLSSVKVTSHKDKSQELHNYLGKGTKPSAIFIDDNKDILRSVKMRHPFVVTILMSRDGVGLGNIGSCAGEGKICFTGIDYEVSSLEQAQRIIDIKNSNYPWIYSLWQKITKKT
ncbi:MAG: hypothetical protein HYV65_03420 [Candidatus Spechtbacteria bacterium]|nr:hypothetical protein [Candidatus Spechtbacteria bacterium]